MRSLISALVLVCLAPACATRPPETSTLATASAAPDERAAAAPELPRVGDPAPPFSLATLDGATISLAEACARGPVVLVFGSFT